MAGTRLDTDQHRRITFLRSLYRRGVFEAVSRNDAVVGICRRNEYSREFRSGLDVVIGRIGVQRFKLFRVVG